MIKVRRIVTGTTLLAAFGLIMIVWVHAGSTPPPTRVGMDSVRAVQLRLNFENGHWANVTAVEGGSFTVERDGKKLALTPFIRDHGQVELRVSQAVQRDGREAMEAVDTLLVDKGLTKLTRGNLPFSVQVLDSQKTLPAAALAALGTTCCVRTCDGTLVCGVCVCTDCGRCGPNWCDCAIPPPPDRK